MYLLNNNKSMRHNRLTPARAATALAQAARRATAALAIILLTAMTAGAQDAITGLTYNSTGGYYEISDAQDLVELANYVKATGNYASSGKTFKQMQDIDMSSISNFTPIGELGGSYSFAGTYDGDGYTISGLTVSIDYGDIGLFGVVKGATVSNVILLSPTVTATMTKNFSVDLGALIGMCGSGSSNRVENCHVVNPTVSSSSTSSDNYVGAIIGNIWYKNTTATNCYYYDGNANAAYGNNPNGATVTNVCAAHLVTPADGVTIQTAMAPALGFTCDTDGDGNAENYWRSGSVLTLGYTGTAPDGYIVSGYTATNGTVGGNANDGYTLTMPNADVTVTATFSTPDPNDFSQSGDTYTIHSAAGWNVFCDLLAQHARGYFSGKTVRLGADITVTRMAGGQPFTGTFDGGGHTLTLDYGTADAPIDAQFVAPFIETLADGNHQPTFRNLTIDGTIYATHTQATDHDHVGGLIGHLFGTVTIEHCTSLVEIHAKVGAGGFVGLCEHDVSFNDCHSAAVIRSADGSNSGFVAWSRASAYTIAFTGCLFDGKLLQQNGSGSLNGGFIGWTGATKTVTITNSLCAPAPLADGETMASSNSATFARGWNATTTATNSYYTAALGTEQGEATRTVAAGTDVTIEAIALTGTATQYTVSGITAYSGGGLQRGETLYYGSDDQLSLTLSNSVTGAPQGYQYGYTASAGTLSGTTLTMPDENVTISVNTAGALLSTRQPVTVAFIKADGTADEASAIALDGTETSLAEGWYFMGKDISYDATLTLGGDVNLILADGCEMKVGESGAPIEVADFAAIDGYVNNDKTFTIYGQALGTGALNVYASGADIPIAISVDALTVNGGNIIADFNGTEIANPIYSYGDININRGTVTTTATGTESYGIYAYNGTVNINGGTVTANGTENSIYGNAVNINGGNVTASSIYSESGNITLGWTNPADFIEVNSYYAAEGGTITLAKAFSDGDGNIYSGVIDKEEDGTYAIDGKKLLPYIPPVNYLDINGTTQTCLNYTVLTGSEETLAEGWYVADGTVSFDHTLRTSGDIHLILKDGAMMRIGTEESPVDVIGIDANEGHSISIHGQSTGESRGQLWINAKGSGIYTYGGNVEISGCEVHAKGNENYSTGICSNKQDDKGGSVIMTNAVVTAESQYGIYSYQGDITLTDCKVTATSDFYGIIAEGDGADVIISGGQVTATATSYYGIAANNISLSWNAPTDFIEANSYSADGGITLAKPFTDGDGNIYSGTISPSSINGKKLLPYIGDANGDYVVTIADVVMVVSYLVNGVEPEGFNFSNADVDGNGTVDTTDLRAIVDMILED